MHTKFHQTIIIGGGISGIECAHQLQKEKQSFLLISDNIGGRITESSTGNVEYGAYYAMSTYHNVAHHIKKGRRIKPSQLQFHNNKQAYSIFNQKLYSHPLQYLKIIFYLSKFKNHYELFKKRSLTIPQIEALQQDPYLWSLYQTSATKFIETHQLLQIVKNYLAEIIQGTTFTSINKLNAFTFLQFSLPIILPIYELHFKKKEIEQQFNKNWIKGLVTKITKTKNGFLINTQQQQYTCKNIVLATPPHISKTLLKFKYPLRGPVQVHMFHLQGTLRTEWKKNEINVFSSPSTMLALAHQQNNTYLFYSKIKNPPFKPYFKKYKILSHKHWNPAFHIEGSNLLPFQPIKNVYLIGDNNICGIEDAGIYGICAANHILKNIH